MWLHISLTTFLTWINKQQTFFWWQPYTPVELNNNNSKGLRFSLRALQKNYFPSACWTLNPLLLIKASQPLKSFLLQASLPSAFLRFSRPHNIPKSSVLPCLTSHFDLNKKKTTVVASCCDCHDIVCGTVLQNCPYAHSYGLFKTCWHCLGFSVHLCPLGSAAALKWLQETARYEDVLPFYSAQGSNGRNKKVMSGKREIII